MLAVIFAIASVVILSKSHVGAPAVEGGVGGMGGFLLTVGTAFGYAAGWTPYAADYTRYLPASMSAARTGLFAAAGLFLSCVDPGGRRRGVGDHRARRSSDNPTEAFTSELALAGWRRRRCWPSRSGPSPPMRSTSIRAQWLSSPSGSNCPHHVARALVTVFFGVAGFLVAWWALADAAASYEAFLLIIAYWIGPWLGVVFADQYLRRGQRIDGFLYDRSYTNWPGLLSFLIGLVVSVLFFCNQEKFVGYVVRAVPQLGDITFFVGFLLAGAAYLVLCRSKIAAERVLV